MTVSNRKIIAWCSVSVDGYSSGPGGPADDRWLHEHAADPARADDTDPRTRELGRWLDAVDKAVVSTTIDDAPWSHSRIFRDPRSAVGALRAEPGRDVLVLNSATLIGSLLREARRRPAPRDGPR